MQRAAVDGHILRHLGVRMGELHEFHSCRNLRTQLVSRAPKIEFIHVRLSKLKAVTHSLIIIGRCRQQDEGEDHGKATNGVQLAVGKRGAQLLPGTFLCKRKNLERANQSSFHREEPEFGGESLCRGVFDLPDRARWAGCPASRRRRSDGRTRHRCRCAKRAWSGIGHSPTTQWPERPAGRHPGSDQRRAPGWPAGSTGCSGCCHPTAGLKANRRSSRLKIGLVSDIIRVSCGSW